MPPDDPEVRPAHEPGAALPSQTPGAPVSAPLAATAAVEIRPVILWGWALVLGTLAAGASWKAEEASRSIVDPNPLSKEVFPGPATALLMAEARLHSGLIAFGLLGGLLGLAFGVAGGLARGSVASAVMAGLIGLFVGAGVAAGAAWFFVPTFYRLLNPHQNEFVLSLLVLSGLWGAVGGAAGLALGIGAGGGQRAGCTLAGGLLGAVVAAMLYVVLTAIRFPLDMTTHPLPGSWPTRLLARLALAVFAATGAALVAKKATRKPRVAPREV